MKSVKRCICAVLCIIMLVAVFGCNKKTNNEGKNNGETVLTPEQQFAKLPDIIECTMLVSEYGQVKFELYKDIAPQTVLNFLYLMGEGFYDGLIFHKVDKGVLIQTGKYETGHVKRTPPFEYGIKGEFSSNGVENPISFTEGTIGMMRNTKGDNAKNSASTEFFICMDRETSYSFDGEFAAFGKVTEGMSVVKKINKAKVSKKAPVEDIAIIQMFANLPDDAQIPLPDFLDENGKKIENPPVHATASDAATNGKKDE